MAEKLHVLEIKPRHIEAYVGWMRDKSYAKGTVGRALSVLREAYDALLRADLIAGNPARAAKVSGLMPEENEEEETPALSDDERQKLLSLPASARRKSFQFKVSLTQWRRRTSSI